MKFTVVVLFLVVFSSFKPIMYQQMYGTAVVPVQMAPNFVYQGVPAAQPKRSIPERKKKSCCTNCCCCFFCLFVFALIFGGALVIFKTIQCGTIDWQEISTYEFSPEDVSNIDVSADLAFVKFSYSSISKIQVHIRLANTDSSSDDEVKPTLEGGLLKVDLTSDPVWFLLHCLRAEVEIELPLNHPLNSVDIRIPVLVSHSMSSSTTGIDLGEMSLVTVDKLKIRTEVGKVFAKSLRSNQVDIRGTLEVASVSMFNTTNSEGEIVRGQMFVKSFVGYQKFNLLHPGYYEFSSISGKISLTLHETFSGKVSTSSRGKIRYEGERLVVSDSGDHSVNFEVGDGNDFVNVHSETGQLSLTAL
ncbi:hypothetical protein P9112_004056 [Eukaryota sp. TZLM1-RC]